MENFHTHDRGYKYLFSNPMLVKELLESFVGMDWVREIDFRRAESINTSFVSDEFKNRESDIIYRLRFKKKELYLYLLIEFQSTVDRHMALRMLRYVLELYEHLIKNKRKGPLPVVFPLLLYNGEGRWTAPDRLSELIDVPDELKQAKAYMPEFRYYPVIENEYSDRTLLQLGNIVSSVFLLENRDRERFMEAIERIGTILEGRDLGSVWTFFVWFEKYLRKNAKIEEIEEGVKKIKSRREVKSMFAKTVEKLEKEWMQKGMKEGMQLGRKEGMQLGKKEGMQLGKKEGMITVARSMLKKGIDEKTVSEVTGLGIDELQSLKK